MSHNTRARKTAGQCPIDRRAWPILGILGVAWLLGKLFTLADPVSGLLGFGLFAVVMLGSYWLGLRQGLR